MSMTASFGTQELARNGAQELSSGLIVHRGQMQASLLRAIGSANGFSPVYPRDGAGSGSGLELVHFPKSLSQIQSYDRETSQWLDLHINAKNINLQPQTGGKLNMPAGSSQAMLGYYWQPVLWTVPAINGWYETSVTCSFTSTSSAFPWRIEWGTSLGNPIKGAVIYVGIGLDGGVSWPSLALFHTTEANYLTTVSGTVYNLSPPPPGPHRVSIFVYTGSAGTAINNGMYSTLWVTEIRA